MEHIPHRWPQPAAALALAAASGRGLHELMFRELQPFRHNRGRLDVCATATHTVHHTYYAVHLPSVRC